jgi:hypothetical protein
MKETMKALGLSLLRWVVSFFASRLERKAEQERKDAECE